MSLVSETVQRCAKKLADDKLKIAFAESATAGMAAAIFALTEWSGTILQGGIVSYDASVKQDLLQIPAAMIKEYTPESAEITRELTHQLARRIHADVHLAITGLTTPGGSESPEKPVGTVFIHVLFQGRDFPLRTVLSGSPEQIVFQAIDQAANLVLQASSSGAR